MADEMTNGGDVPAADRSEPPPTTAVVPTADAPPPLATLPVPVPPSTRPINVLSILLAALVVAAVWLPLQLWGLNGMPFHTKGEPREALMVQSIVRDGQWILPRRNGVELPAKPPLFHWLGALAARLHGGIDEGTVRLPSAICSLLAALIVLVTGTIAWSVVAGLTAALTLLTSFEWLRAATSARVDMTLTLGLTLAMCSLLVLHMRGSRLAALGVALGSAWAVLSKGPIGLALPLLLALFMLLVDRSLSLLRAMRLFRTLLIVGLAAASWYGLAFMEGGPDFLRKQVLTENVWRFVGTSNFTEGHRHSVLYLFGVLLAGLLPWTLLFPGVGAALWRTRRMIGRHDPQTFLLVWTIVVFVFYAVARSKRGVYLLALYPALFLLLGWWVHHASENVVTRRGLAQALPPMAWVWSWLCGTLTILTLLAYAGLPVIEAIPALLDPRAGREAYPVVHAIDTHARLTAVLFAIATATAAGAALVAARQRWGLLLAFLVVSTAALGIAVRQVVMPAVAETTSRRSFNDAVRRIVGPEATVSAYRSFDYGSVYYWNANIPVHAEPLSASGPATLIAAEESWARATPLERRFYQRVPFIESARGGNIGRLIVLQRRTAQ
jgi:4-amino-4-deoxy-L-arabinose transferase-like glycosyltransferase